MQTKISAEIGEKMQEIETIDEKLLEIKKRLEELSMEIDAIKGNNIFSSAKLVGATLHSAALNKKIQIAEFDMIIVDEASMALIPLIVAAAQALNDKPINNIDYKDDENLYEAQNDAVRTALNSQLVLVGDPRQLSPIAKTHQMKKSIFDLYGIDRIFEGEEVEDTVFLDINFRNHPDIVELVSNLFYGGLLKSGKECNGKKSLYLKRSTSPMTPFEGSFINQGNAAQIFEQVRAALSKGRRSIGVITPYRKQAEFLNRSFRDLRTLYPDADLQAGTVHKFQGKEKDVVIFDITYSPSTNKVLPKAYDGDIKSETAKLLNVAMTRAEDFFILVGDADGILNINNKENILTTWIEGINKLAS